MCVSKPPWTLCQGKNPFLLTRQLFSVFSPISWDEIFGSEKIWGIFFGILEGRKPRIPKLRRKFRPKRCQQVPKKVWKRMPHFLWISFSPGFFDFSGKKEFQIFFSRKSRGGLRVCGPLKSFPQVLPSWLSHFFSAQIKTGQKKTFLMNTNALDFFQFFLCFFKQFF